MQIAEVAPGCPIITQAFGCTSFAGEWAVSGAVCPSGWFHRGVDLAGANCCDTPLLAAGSGEIRALGQSFTGSGGLGPGAILLGMDDGMLAVYGHGYAECSVGQRVQKGERIGRVGTQGFSTGCHLHLEICSQLGTVPGGCVNPLSYDGPGEAAPEPEEEVDKLLVVFSVQGGTYVSDGIHYRWVASEWDNNALGYNWSGNQLKNIGPINGFAGFGVPADRATAEMSGQEWEASGPRGPAG
jgi:hypothetical protein